MLLLLPRCPQRAACPWGGVRCNRGRGNDLRPWPQSLRLLPWATCRVRIAAVVELEIELLPLPRSSSQSDLAPPVKIGLMLVPALLLQSLLLLLQRGLLLFKAPTGSDLSFLPLEPVSYPLLLHPLGLFRLGLALRLLQGCSVGRRSMGSC